MTQEEKELKAEAEKKAKLLPEKEKCDFCNEEGPAVRAIIVNGKEIDQRACMYHKNILDDMEMRKKNDEGKDKWDGVICRNKYCYYWIPPESKDISAFCGCDNGRDGYPEDCSQRVEYDNLARTETVPTGKEK